MVNQNLWEYCPGICILEKPQVINMHNKFNYHFFQLDVQTTVSFSQLPRNHLQNCFAISTLHCTTDSPQSVCKCSGLLNRSTHNTLCVLPLICHLPEATHKGYALATLGLNWSNGLNWLKGCHEAMSRNPTYSMGFPGFKILHYHCLTVCFEQILLPLCFFSIKCK